MVLPEVFRQEAEHKPLMFVDTLFSLIFFFNRLTTPSPVYLPPGIHLHIYTFKTPRYRLNSSQTPWSLPLPTSQSDFVCFPRSRKTVLISCCAIIISYSMSNFHMNSQSQMFQVKCFWDIKTYHFSLKLLQHRVRVSRLLLLLISS